MYFGTNGMQATTTTPRQWNVPSHQYAYTHVHARLARRGGVQNVLVSTLAGAHLGEIKFTVNLQFASADFFGNGSMTPRTANCELNHWHIYWLASSASQPTVINGSAPGPMAKWALIRFTVCMLNGVPGVRDSVGHIADRTQYLSRDTLILAGLVLAPFAAASRALSHL